MSITVLLHWDLYDFFLLSPLKPTSVKMLANTLSIICMTFEILGACQSTLWEFSVLSVLQTEALSSSLSILDTIYIRDLLQLQTSFTKSFVPPPPLERWSASSAFFCPTNDKVLHKSWAFSLSYSMLHECDPGFWYFGFPQTLSERRTIPDLSS